MLWLSNTPCLGKAKSAAKTELEKLKMADMTCAEVIKEAAKIIFQVHDEVSDPSHRSGAS